MIGEVLFFTWLVIFFVHYIAGILSYGKMSTDCCPHVVVLTLIPVIFMVILITSLCNAWAKSSCLEE